MPVVENYQPKERALRAIEDMTSREVAETLALRLRAIEALQTPEELEYAKLYHPSVIPKKGEVSIRYMNFHGGQDLSLDIAKRYLKFLSQIETVAEFQTHHIFYSHCNLPVKDA